jgi:hypothetical protein
MGVCECKGGQALQARPGPPVNPKRDSTAMQEACARVTSTHLRRIATEYGIQQSECFAPSPRRPYVEDKRMVLEHTHGLFIT